MVRKLVSQSWSVEQLPFKRGERQSERHMHTEAAADAAEAAADAAVCALGETLKASGTVLKPSSAQLFGDLGLEEEGESRGADRRVGRSQHRDSRRERVCAGSEMGSRGPLPTSW